MFGGSLLLLKILVQQQVRGTIMERKTTLDGHDLKAMFNAGADWLEKIVPDINALNVYPVPDGDCGTNMLLTIRASLEQTARLDGGAGSVAVAMAKGALMGARGNSGVILSQIWRGFAQELKDKTVITAKDLARALNAAAETAYLALSNPVEGTILTVMRDAAHAAEQEATNTDAGSILVLAAAVNAARASVINTPNLLPVLKDAGVVDAGGHGMYTILEGAWLYLKRDMDNRSPELLSRQIPLVTMPITSLKQDSYGFCTQFMVRGVKLSLVKLRGALAGLGESLIVVGDGSTVRIHIHTHDVKAVTNLASSFGTIFDIDIRNMDQQHEDFLLMTRGKMSGMSTAVISVVNGDGLVNVFADLGAAAIVPGGQTVNPSTIEIIRTVEQVPSNNVILLPNNKNVIPTALLAQALTKKNLIVIHSETIPEGISALVAFIPEADFETNAKQMAAAIATVKTIEVTQATRATKLNDLDIKSGQFIGLLGGELLTVGNTPTDVIIRLLARIDLVQAHIITLYFGKDTNESEATKVSTRICEAYPEVNVGIVKGGQPNYYYIISIE